MQLNFEEFCDNFGLKHLMLFLCKKNERTNPNQSSDVYPSKFFSTNRKKIKEQTQQRKTKLWAPNSVGGRSFLFSASTCEAFRPKGKHIHEALCRGGENERHERNRQKVCNQRDNRTYPSSIRKRSTRFSYVRERKASRSNFLCYTLKRV